MNKRIIIALFMALMVKSEGMAATAQTAATTLLRSVGARPAALGQAYVAVSGDVHTFMINPAGMADLPDSAISATYLKGFIDDQLGSFSYGQPLPVGVLSVGIVYFNAGTIDLNLSSGVQETRTAQEDMVGMVGYSIGEKGPLALGVTGKWFKLQLAEEAQATGWAVDAGAIYRTPLKGFQLGGAVQNMGPDVTYEVDAEPLPRLVRWGGAYQFKMNPFHLFDEFPLQFLLSADEVQLKKEEDSFHGGLEIKKGFLANQTLSYAALRGGYEQRPQSYTLGVGAGLGRVELDYSVGFLGDLGNSQKVTLSYVFSKGDDLKEKNWKTNKRLGY